MGSKSTIHHKKMTVTKSKRVNMVTTETDGSLKKTLVHNRTTSANIVGWKAKIEAGQDASTTLFATRFTVKAADGVKLASYNAGWPTPNKETLTGQIAVQHLDQPSTVDSSTVNQAVSMAEVNFAKSYRKKSQTWSGGVFCGELLETAKLMANPAKGIRKGINALYDNAKRVLKGQNGRDPTGKVARSLAETYLEWKFGIQPLIRDVDDAALAFRKLSLGRTFDMVRVFGTAEGENRVSSLSGPVTFNPGAGFVSNELCQIDVNVVDKVEVTIRGAWRNSNPSGDMPIPLMFGVSAIDIIPTAWELIPWSFFADYFINIGDVLDAWSMRFVDFAWMNQTTRSCRTLQLSDVYARPGGTLNHVAYGGHAEFKRYDVSRVKKTNHFETGFHVQIPGFEKSGRWLNIASLLAMRGRPNFS